MDKKFPMFISLTGRKVLVAGAGTIAARRIHVLNHFGARVYVVAPQKRSTFEGTFFAREFQESDLDDVVLAVAATDDRAVNQQISRLCAARGIPVSVADCAEESTFFFPAICEGGGLIAGLISDGRHHHAVSRMANRIRALLEAKK